MESRDYLEIVRHYWKSALGVALTVLVAAAAITFLPSPKYTATTRLFLGVPSRSVQEAVQGLDFTAQQMKSYAEVATSPLVLEPVTRQLNLGKTSDELATITKVTVPLNTVILEIEVTDSTPARAAAIANAVGAQFAAVVGEVVPTQKDASEPVRATVLTRGIPPSAPSSPQPIRNLTVGIGLALLAGLATAFLRFALSSKLRNERDLLAITEVPVLGVIPHTRPADLRLEGRSAQQGPRGEAVRRLRANLRFVAEPEWLNTILVSSAVWGEGTSSTARDLALAMADAGVRVVLLEADLRRPTLAHDLNLPQGSGLSHVLIGEADPADVVYAWPGTTVAVVPAGEVPPNPSDLLGSARMAPLMQRLSATFEVVLIDGPAILEVSDSLELSRHAGCALLVVSVNRIQRRQLAEALASFETADAKLVGLVINEARVKPWVRRRRRKRQSALPTWDNWQPTHPARAQQDKEGVARQNGNARPKLDEVAPANHGRLAAQQDEVAPAINGKLRAQQNVVAPADRGESVSAQQDEVARATNGKLPAQQDEVARATNGKLPAQQDEVAPADHVESVPAQQDEIAATEQVNGEVERDKEEPTRWPPPPWFAGPVASGPARQG
ncbi:MAG TPA: polysaccharide biosynthesis tyrosine autokinase [Propionibacteriaceae bacterium]|nr:polysaccharide biosynthesis tyrosine autokinase [Propionibacteriaceae bacterium]